MSEDIHSMSLRLTGEIRALTAECDLLRAEAKRLRKVLADIQADCVYLWSNDIAQKCLSG